MQINQTTLTNLYKGFRAIFMAAYQGSTDVLWEQLAMRTDSSGESEEYDWLGAVPGLRELIDEVQIRNLSAHGFVIRNKEWESTVGVKRAKIERDTYGIYNPLMQSMGVAARQHPDELVANLLINGFTTTCYTGKNFFDANHEPKAGGTKFSNKSTKKLSADEWAKARANIIGRKNSEGRSMKLGRDLALVVAPHNESLAKQILEAERDAAGATNIQRNTGRVITMPELAGATDEYWFALELGQPVRPFIVQVEKEVDLVSVTNPDDSHVVKHQEFLYQAYCRHNAGYGLPELAYGSTGVTA